MGNGRDQAPTHEPQQGDARRGSERLALGWQAPLNLTMSVRFRHGDARSSLIVPRAAKRKLVIDSRAQVGQRRRW
ncbi:hypothetical protein CDL15_Pgr025593 [Punica granatum]|uniref:Uncharacterized protein n=1 Tax=Punica granatum TaxID=22663 RepID=A0A218WA53_PUNGR|nr:hypothetical protein CDL15_Pgr025593 [Punica granatum]PKI68185.1 hypothetical protein CRG98_011484 [Punica granatum]